MNKRLLLYAIFGEDYRIACEKKDYVPTDETVEEVLSTLTPREKLVIEGRFADKRMTLQAVGNKLPRRYGGIGVCREVARALEAKALRKLRHPRRSRLLWPDWYLHKKRS